MVGWRFARRRARGLVIRKCAWYNADNTLLFCTLHAHPRAPHRAAAPLRMAWFWIDRMDRARVLRMVLLAPPPAPALAHKSTRANRAAHSYAAICLLRRAARALRAALPARPRLTRGSMRCAFSRASARAHHARAYQHSAATICHAAYAAARTLPRLCLPVVLYPRCLVSTSGESSCMFKYRARHRAWKAAAGVAPPAALLLRSGEDALARFRTDGARAFLCCCITCVPRTCRFTATPYSLAYEWTYKRAPLSGSWLTNIGRKHGGLWWREVG